jgi:hypothetical protein
VGACCAQEGRKLENAADRFRATLLLHRSLRGWCWHVLQQRQLAEQQSAAAAEGSARSAQVAKFLSAIGAKGGGSGGGSRAVAAAAAVQQSTGRDGTLRARWSIVAQGA